MNPELATDYIRLQEIQDSIDEQELLLLDLMAQWDELMEEVNAENDSEIK